MIGQIKNLLENPIFLKDFNIRKRKENRKKIRIPGYLGYLAVLTVPMIIIGMFYIITNSGDPQKWDGHLWDEYLKTAMVITVFLQLIYFVFKSITYSFPLFSQEREQRTYGGLISSMMSPKDILRGKFMVAFYPLFLEVTGFLPLFVGIGLLFKMTIAQIGAIYIISVIVILFFTLLGLYCSLTSASSAKAHSRAAFIAGFLVLGTLLIDGLIATLAHDFIPFTVFLNPGAAFASVLFSSSYSPAWFTLLALICPILLLLVSFALWQIMAFEASRLPEK